MKQHIALILLVVLTSSCYQAEVKSTAEVPAESVVAPLENPFIHSVYFWFRDDVTEAQLETFYADTEKLRGIEVVKAMYTGKASSTDRPIVERSYDFAVIVHFENLAGHDAYQQDPIHLALLEKHASLWEKIMITDVE